MGELEDIGRLDDLLRPYLDDPEEGPLLRRVLEDPGDRDLRTSYGELLQRRGDPRAGLVFGRLPMNDAKVMNAVAPLFGKLPFDAWFSAMQARSAVAPIRNCGLGKDAGSSRWGGSRFKFQCPRTWDTLAPTADPKVRSCDACKEDVYFCDDDHELLANARAGRCVAMREPEERWLSERAHRMVPSVWTGRPQPVDYLEQLVRSEDG